MHSRLASATSFPWLNSSIKFVSFLVLTTIKFHCQWKNKKMYTSKIGHSLIDWKNSKFLHNGLEFIKNYLEFWRQCFVVFNFIKINLESKTVLSLVACRNFNVGHHHHGHCNLLNNYSIKIAQNFLLNNMIHMITKSESFRTTPKNILELIFLRHCCYLALTAPQGRATELF